MNIWLERAKALPPGRLLDSFQLAFDALWARAHRSLGDVTLTAIADRVLSAASEAFPALGTMQVEPRPLLFRDFRARADVFTQPELMEAVRFILVEFLTVLGNLTADILTPALHAELANAAHSVAAPDADPERTQGARTHRGRHPKKRGRATRARKS